MADIMKVDIYTAAEADRRFQPRGDYATRQDLTAAQGAGTPGLLVLGKDDPVPAGTRSGTVIVRKER